MREATRTGILSAFHDKLAHGGVRQNDRIFVFFAGHGATRKLSSGRDLGYIVPADSDPNQFATDAIPMTEIQNIAESLSAKHVLFVMDACYSGLGLTRGGGAATFLATMPGASDARCSPRAAPTSWLPMAGRTAIRYSPGHCCRAWAARPT